MNLSLDLVGWSPLLVLPLAVAAGWGLARLGRAERAHLPQPAARRLAWLRGCVGAALVLLLIEPVLTIIRERSELPVVAVLLDGSGSMGVHDVQAAPTARLDEAIVLGLLPAAERPDAPRRAATQVAAAAAGDADRRRELRPVLATAAEALAGQPRAAAAVAAVVAALAAGDQAGLATAAAAAQPALAAAQAELDAAQASGAPAGSPLARALADLAARDRRDRAGLWLERVLAPALAGKAQVRVLGMDGRLDAVAPGAAPPSGPTDPHAALAALARGWSDVPLGGVLVLGDGRQTAGADPAPAARALLARGAPVHAVAVGDPQPPRDLAVAEVTAPAEVMQGERIPLEVRWHAVGYDGIPLELLLLRDGRELERRSVAGGDGAWRSERFEPAAGEPGLAGFQVRLQRRETVATGGAGTWERTWWDGGNERLSECRSSGLPQRAPAGRDTVAGAASLDAPGQNQLVRIAGNLVPPVAGEYILHLCADDSAELALTLDGRRRVVAEVPTWVERGQWDRHPGQRSQRLALAAGKPVPVELWLAQGSGAGFAAIGWTRPDGVVERPIPAEHCNGAEPAPAADERPEASAANNQAAAVVQVHGDPLRVLLVDRTPRWESRYLASLLMRDRRVQVDRRWLLSELAAGERGAAPRPLLPAGPGELERYDAVVLGDLGATDLAPGDEARLADFVERRGGFLALIAGERAMPGSLGLGRLSQLVPVRPASAAATPQAGSRLQLTPAGRRHPVTMLLEDPAKDPEVWPLLAVPQWLAGGTARTGAEVLVELGDAGRTPVLVAGRAGSGRILYLGTHEAWRWRDRLGERLHQTLWLQAFRWGLGSRLRGADPRLQAALDAPVAAPGETVELRLRSVGPDGAPAPAPEVVVEALDAQGAAIPGSARTIAPAALGDGAAALPGQWRAALEGLAPGRWRVRVAGRGPAAGLSELRELAVRERSGSELADLATDGVALARLAAAGGGTSAHLLQAGPVVEALTRALKPREQRSSAVHALWDGWLPMLLIVGLLLAEWLLRRRAGLP